MSFKSVDCRDSENANSMRKFSLNERGDHFFVHLDLLLPENCLFGDGLEQMIWKGSNGSIDNGHSSCQ